MTDTAAPLAARRLALPEFTAMLAMLFATIAFSIDAMLPALPAIAAELTPDAVNRAQLILTAFVLGMGVGTIAAGPISDAVGRRPAIFGGFALYVAGALLAHRAQSLEILLLARLLQGLGAAAPRIVGLALVRDLYQGREMARVSSFVMMVFMVVPAVAPSLGQVIIHVWDWRAVFLAFVAFAAAGALWIGLRQPETLPPERRRPLSPGNLASAAREVLSDRDVMLCTAVMALGFGQMFALLSSIQQLFADAYGQGRWFPQWFALIALFSASASFVNSRLVVRLGMRRVCLVAYAVQALFSLAALAVIRAGLLSGLPAFALFFVWATSIFFMAGLTFGNLNALSLQRMGHIAGMAASIVASVATVAAVFIAAPVGLMFDGTAVPVMAGAALCSALAWLMMRRIVEAPVTTPTGHA
ncbi:MAG: MFS transporter [Rhodobacteraceae bacterium]|nr:MFS transporter [Paracoccaceae bacterium]